MRFGSVCSGIEAASVAWNPLGWKAAWLSEIEPFPSAVLSHHYPDAPNYGDMTALPEMIMSEEIEAPDIFCGGTPCQAFSVAGLRKSLDDARGNLSLTFCEIANAIDAIRTGRGEQPCIVFWENVPGVLSTKDNAFGCFLGKLAGEDRELHPTGGKWTNAGCVHGPKRTIAWRVLDAQYFGVAQRRRRVFVVASARDDFDPAAILFESEGVRRDSAPSREPGKGAAGAAARGFGDGGENIARCITTGEAKRQDYETCTMVAQPTYGIPGNWIGRAPENGGSSTQFMEEMSPCLTSADRHGVAQPIPFGVSEQPDVGHCLRSGASKADKHESTTYVAQPIAFHPTQDPITSEDGTTHAMGCGSKQGNATVAIAFSAKDYGGDATADLSPTLRAMPHDGSHANGGGQMAVCVTGDVTHTLKAEGFDASENGTGWGQASAAVAFPIGLDEEQNAMVDAFGTLKARTAGGGFEGTVMQTNMAVRRLTPVECERLQGFPDNYTNIPWRTWQEASRKGISYETLLTQRGMTLRGQSIEECPDGPRYKALGNSWAVPVVRWIGRRIAEAIEIANEVKTENNEEVFQ